MTKNPVDNGGSEFGIWVESFEKRNDDRHAGRARV